MKHPEDDKTVDMLPVPAKRGRPATGEAKSGAQRVAALRERRRQEGKRSVTVFVSVEVAEALDKYLQFKDLTKDEAMDRALKAFFRKR